MEDNRRNFIKKSASVTAALTLGGINSAMSESRETTKKTVQAKPYVKDAGIKFAFLMGPTSPKVPFARQMGVLHAVSGVEKVEGFNADRKSTRLNSSH